MTFRLTPYGRMDASATRLGGYSEKGGSNPLHHGSSDITLTEGVGGGYKGTYAESRREHGFFLRIPKEW